jgi:hypothetical protein
MAMKQKDNWICLLCHSSEISITTALTNRKQESSLANILATFVRCLPSRIYYFERVKLNLTILSKNKIRSATLLFKNNSLN